MKKYIFD